MRKRRKEEDGRAEDRDRCPHHRRLLRNLYGPERVRSLQEFLSNDETTGLVRDGDPVEYLTLLQQSFAVLSEGAPDGIRVGTRESISQRWSQQQVVERSIQLHLREGSTSNVLCFGYGQVQSTGSSKQLPDLKGPEYHHLNVATGFVSTHLWVTLLARVGEERMLYLLSYAAIFVPLPNHCLLQVAGHPFTMAASNTRQVPRIVSTSRKSPTGLQQAEEPINSSVTNMETRPMDVDQDMTRSGRRVRPSSWARRKRRRLEGTHVVSERSVPEPTPPPRSIDRSAIFYHSSFSSHAGLPANHILNTSSVNEVDITRLLGSMFPGADITSEELTKNVKVLLRKMLRNAKRCNYARLLSRHCPLPSDLASPLPKATTPGLQAKKQQAKSSWSLLKDSYATQEEIEVNLRPSGFQEMVARNKYKRLSSVIHGSSKKICNMARSSKPGGKLVDEVAGPTPDLAKLVTLSTSHGQVVNFLWAVCRSLVPEEFLGSEKFRRSLCSGIASFVSLRRYETFHVEQLLTKLQMSWPEGISSERMLLDWLHWLFTQIIIPLLRSHFYVTEAENHRQNVLYYRKPVWAKIHMLSLNHLVAKCYTRLEPGKVAELLQKRVLGFSHVRMLPKHSGVRPIANLSSRTRCTLPLRSREVKLAFKSINSRLRGAHTCLKFEQESRPEDMGASVFGYKDAYVKFLPYIMHLKSLSGGLPQMYMAVCDISRAYDTIKQEKLCEVVAGFLRLPAYHIRRYVTIFNTMGSARASYKQTCTTSDQELDILNVFMDLAAKRSHSILQDQGVVTRLKQGHILGLIEEHVKRNIVKIGPHYYQQKSGIAQGSVLSPLLCSMFFGHLDEHVLMPLLGQPESAILLRLIDDSLFISTSQSAVARFVQLMHDGFEEYGCHANQQKTAVSFDVHLGNQVRKADGVYMTNDGASFMRWSGLLINCCTLEVQADYTRYIGEPIKGSITVVRKTNPGAQVPIKLCHFVRAKCHPMLYDLRINSPSTIRLNAYQAFLLCAMKFHAYLCSMDRTCRHHPPFLFKAIEVTSSYMHGLLRKKMQEVGDSVHLGVTREEMTWLASHAFLKVLNKKQSRYVELLLLIKERLDMPKYRFMGRCPHLASARDENRSTMFTSIIY